MGGLTAVGCIRGTKPIGWSGGVVADETVYLGSLEGKLVAVSTDGGTIRWSDEITTTNAAGFGCSASSIPVPFYGTLCISSWLMVS